MDRATLRCAGIASLGELSDEDAATLSTLKILDLQCNLLSSWRDVAEIVSAAPALTSLDVSGNVLRLDDDADLAPLRQLRSLAANGVGLRSWADVLRLGARAPELETLHVAGNPVCGGGSLGGDLDATFSKLALLDVANTGHKRVLQCHFNSGVERSMV